MSNQEELFDQFSSCYKAYLLALRNFLSEDVFRVEVMKKHLLGEDRSTAIFLLKYLSEDELKQLFNELVFLSSFTHGAIGFIRQVIISMPRDWVLRNIQLTSGPILAKGGFEEYRRLLELYLELDRNLTFDLAQQALKSQDYDIREAGDDFLLLIGNI